MSLISTPRLALTVTLIFCFFFFFFFFLVHFPCSINVWTKITKSTGGFTVSNRLALSLWGCAPRRSSFPYKSGSTTTTMSSSYRAILCTLQTLTDHPRTCPLFHGYSPSPSPDKGRINFGPWSNYSIDNQHYLGPTSNSPSLFLMSMFIYLSLQYIHSEIIHLPYRTLK